MTYTAWNDLSALEQAATIYSDMHKDAYGFRPREGGVHKPETLEDYKAAFDSMGETIARSEAEEADAAAQALAAVEAEIAALEADHGIDHATALRWWFNANGYEQVDYGDGPMDCRQEADHVLWKRGVPMREWAAMVDAFLPRPVEDVS